MVQDIHPKEELTPDFLCGQRAAEVMHTMSSHSVWVWNLLCLTPPNISAGWTLQTHGTQPRKTQTSVLRMWWFSHGPLLLEAHVSLGDRKPTRSLPEDTARKLLACLASCPQSNEYITQTCTCKFFWGRITHYVPQHPSLYWLHYQKRAVSSAANRGYYGLWAIYSLQTHRHTLPWCFPCVLII